MGDELSFIEVTKKNMWRVSLILWKINCLQTLKENCRIHQWIEKEKVIYTKLIKLLTFHQVLLRRLSTRLTVKCPELLMASSCYGRCKILLLWRYPGDHVEIMYNHIMYRDFSGSLLRVYCSLYASTCPFFCPFHIFLPKFSNSLPFFAILNIYLPFFCLFLKSRMHVLTFWNRPWCIANKWRWSDGIVES